MSSTPKSSHEDAGLDSLPTTRFSIIIEGFLTQLGKGASWLWIVVIVVITITIIVRYGATRLGIETDSYLGRRLLSSVFWEELSWYIYGYAWLLALAYALVWDDHVRVDLLHEKFSRKTQVWIEIFGLLFFFLPVFIAIACHGLDFAMESFSDSEGSQQLGLDFRWVAKLSIFIAAVLLLLAGFSRLLRCSRFITRAAGKKTTPLLVAVQTVGGLYLFLVFYFMYLWSSGRSELMAVFRILGL
ncbi:TRAP transporter small permease subunit [bacterium]|nr:TRAP transporter small permease subunit [bacterium]